MTAIGKYLTLRGYEIVERGWAHGGDTADYTARDGETVVLVIGRVHANCGEGFPSDGVDRRVFESLAAAYLVERPELACCELRADAVSALVVSEDRALVRHRTNALGACGLNLSP